MFSRTAWILPIATCLCPSMHGVNAQEDVHAVAGSLGNLGGADTSVQPRGYAAVTTATAGRPGRPIHAGTGIIGAVVAHSASVMSVGYAR